MFKKKILDKYDNTMQTLKYERDKIDNKVNIIAGAFFVLETVKVITLIQIAKNL